MRSAEAVSLPRLRCWHWRQPWRWAGRCSNLELRCRHRRQPRSSAPSARNADLQRIAGPEPTPIGSVGSDAIRDQLVAALSAAGFNVEVQTGVGSQTFESTTVAGRVDNVVASLAGQDSTGSVVLAAHYDSAGESAVRDGCRHPDCHVGQPEPYERPMDGAVRPHF
jgi:hypothetical protein